MPPPPFGGESRLLYIARKVVVGNDCWEWTGWKNHGGYAMFGERVDGKKVQTRAHRAMYEIMRGPIPEGLVIDHLCRNRGCVRPAHMELVTIAENVMRGEGQPAKNRLKTHCPSGHEYSSGNTHVNSSGYRSCLACGRVKKQTGLRRVVDVAGAILAAIDEPERPIPTRIAKPKATHCQRGHAFSAENTLIHQGFRKCKACTTATRMRWRAKRSHAA